MSLILEWSNEQNEREIPDSLIDKLKELLAIAGEAERVVEGEVALTLVDDEEIHRLNRDYRGIDRPTDVLSFAMRETGDDELEIVYEDADEDGEDGEPFVEPLGDIIISVPRAAQQAEEYGHSFERELGFLFVHGFLHLIGYDHQDDAAEKAMFGKQEVILEKAGLLR